jgi:hypothetical protein
MRCSLLRRRAGLLSRCRSARHRDAVGELANLAVDDYEGTATWAFSRSAAAREPSFAAYLYLFDCVARSTVI